MFGRNYRAVCLIKVSIVAFALYVIVVLNVFDLRSTSSSRSSLINNLGIGQLMTTLSADDIDAPIALRTPAPPKHLYRLKQTTEAATNNKTTEVLREQACRVPELDIDDPSIAEYFKQHPVPLECNEVEKNWVKTSGQKFIITAEASAKHGAISCEYKPFWRINEDNNDDMRRETHTEFKNGSQLLTDFFQTVCSGNDGAFYRNTYATVIPQTDTLKRLQSVKRDPKAWAGLNVLVFGFDSLSRLTFMRKLKQTYAYLMQKEAVVLKGYNIVGDGTPQAFIPILTGGTEPELPLTRKRFSDAHYVNIYPFIWNNFSDAGYATQYGEDAALIGTFTYRLKGFNKQPVDHYMRPFWQVVETDERQHHKSYCLGSDPQHVLFWRYARDLLQHYPADVPKFSVLHYSYLTHDDLNQPELIDADFVDHMKDMEANGHLNQSLIIVMSDHGHRFAKIRGTYQGQIEERLPFMSFTAPKWWREGIGRQQWQNLKANVDRLTSPFDIHATLAEILHWNPSLQPEDPIEDLPNLPRELSLWHPIPLSRTCAQAGMESHWCTCLDWVTVPNNDPVVLKLASALLQKINDATLKERTLCAPLIIKEIVSAKKLMPDEKVLKYAKAADADGFVGDFSNNAAVDFAEYQIKVRTTPGVALYEATLSYDQRVASITIDLNSVQHVNKFGDTPHCIIDKNYFLATYCVCYDKIEEVDELSNVGKPADTLKSSDVQPPGAQLS